MRCIRSLGLLIISAAWMSSLFCTIYAARAAELPPIVDEITPRQTDWTADISLPKFNPLSGTLTSVVITLSGVVSGRVGYESLDTATTTVRLALQANVSIRRPDNSQLFLIVPNATLTETVAPYDGVIDFDGPSGDQRSLAARTTETYTLQSPADLALFSGIGSVTLRAMAAGSSTASGPGNVRLERQAQAAGVVATAVYRYVNPNILLEKTVYLGHDGGTQCPGGELAVGAVNVPVTYCFAITNTGDSHLDIAAFSDPNLGIALADLTPLSGTMPLAPNAQLFYYYETTLARPLLNTATVVGNPVDENGQDIPNAPNPTDSDTAAVDVFAPAITIAKTVYRGHDNGGSCPGVELLDSLPNAPATYCFQITNTGNTYLNNIVLTDTILGIALTDLTLISGTTPLQPGASLFYTYDAIVTNALHNIASTEGNPTDALGNDLPNLRNPTDDDDARVNVVQPATVGDYVWLDDNINGLQDPGESGINGVTVHLLDGSGNPTGRTVTTANHPVTGRPGWYEFTDLLPGSYQLEFVNPNRFQYVFSTQNKTDGRPDADERDSDVDIVSGRTATFTLAAGQTDLTFDAALIAPTSLGDDNEPLLTKPLFLPFVTRQ